MDRIPPTVPQLVARIDEALATARASEATVTTVGAAALDAADQARRAAELAERASATALAAAENSTPRASPVLHTVALPRRSSGERDDRLREFSARADRLVARLRQVEASPKTS